MTRTIVRTAAGAPYAGDHSEYLRAVARMIRGAGRRIGAGGDPDDLAELLELREHLDQAIGEALHDQRARHSLAEIAAALGISRQAVHAMSRRR